jgi:hypothetical protein
MVKLSNSVPRHPGDEATWTELIAARQDAVRLAIYCVGLYESQDLIDVARRLSHAAIEEADRSNPENLGRHRNTFCLSVGDVGTSS